MSEPDITTPWHPMKDPVDLKTMGKLSEELAEAIIAVAEFQRAYAHSAIPHDRVLDRLKAALVCEFGDVLANLELTNERFSLHQPFKIGAGGMILYGPSRLIIDLALVSNIVARSIIQGLDGVDPSLGLVNRERLGEAMKHVSVAMFHFAEQQNLDREAIQARREKKKAYLSQVHAGA